MFILHPVGLDLCRMLWSSIKLAALPDCGVVLDAGLVGFGGLYNIKIQFGGLYNIEGLVYVFYVGVLIIYR